MSDDFILTIYEVQAELIETKQELDKIRKEHEELKNQVTANNLAKIVENFQATFSKNLEEIKENLNTLSLRDSDPQSRTLSNSLAIAQRDVTTLSARVSNHDQLLSEINETLKEMNETSNKQNKNIQSETILLLGGWGDSVLMLESGQNWKRLNIKLPYAMYGHGAQFLNNNLYIFGGRGKEAIFNFTYKLSKNLQWEEMTCMNQTRYGIPNSNVILNNQIWVCGGWNKEDDALESVEMYDPETNKWKYMKEMNEDRADAAAAVVNGKIFCSGGWGCNSVECYDPSSDVWTIICNMPQAIKGHGVVEIDGNFIVIGGSFGDFQNSKKVWALSTTDKKARWIKKPSICIARSYFTIAKIHNKIFVCGGETNEDDRIKTSDDVEIFDGKVWKNGSKMPIYRRDAPAVVISIESARYLK